jgi:hypothetical protein
MGLDLHVDRHATHGMGKAVPGLHFAADALHLPTMALIEAPAFVAPHFTLAARPQRQMIVADHDRILNRSGHRQGGACRCTAFNQYNEEEGRRQTGGRVYREASQRQGGQDPLGWWRAR